jgi:hypothetical protein
MSIWFVLAVLAAVVIYLSVPFAYFNGKRRAGASRAFGREAVTADARRPLRVDN